MIHFVGAGPGAVDLITLRGAKLLSQATLCVYAGSLVNPELLQLCPKDCRCVDSAPLTLEETHQVMVEEVKKGGFVVRLHTGDPSIYGAIAEQMDLLDAAGVSYDLVPGVSSFQAAAATLKAELTLPEVSQTVILTRAAGRTPVPEAENLSSLAQHKTTLCLFLSSSLAQTVKAELLEGGYDPQTPVAVVYRASWPDERLLHTTLEALPKAMEEAGVRSQAQILVGAFLRRQGTRSKLYDGQFQHACRR